MFFQGGAVVEIEKLQAWPEPKDFDAHWAAERKILERRRSQVACASRYWMGGVPTRAWKRREK